jgi:hypothetical protein
MSNTNRFVEKIGALLNHGSLLKCGPAEGEVHAMSAQRFLPSASRYVAFLVVLVCLLLQSANYRLPWEVGNLQGSAIVPGALPLTPPNVSEILQNSSSPRTQPLTPTNVTPALAHEVSSVDYRTCCGLGHRLTKTSDAYYLASRLGFGLRTFWGFCNGTEVFDSLFGPQPLDELSNLTNHSHYLRVNNEVPGFQPIFRVGTNNSNLDACGCSLSKAESDVSFYSGLRGRFFARTKVDEFRKANDWDNPDVLVIGMHARVGNGEAGYFIESGRVIPDLDGWIASLATLLLNLTETLASSSGRNRAVKLLIATDTSPVVQGLTTHLKDRITVASYEQPRPLAGQGVLVFHGMTSEGQVCRDAWENSVIDMALLSHADLIVAARYSSFVQSMPLSLALSRPLFERKVNHTYCEVSVDATELQCFASYQEWCCTGRTRFGRAMGSESLNIPVTDFQEQMRSVATRPQEGCTQHTDCLPYDWTNLTGRR